MRRSRATVVGAALWLWAGSALGSGAASASAAGPPVAARTHAGASGYWLLGADGGVFAFGPSFYGSGSDTSPDACSFTPQPPSTLDGADGCDAMAAVPDGGGYWLLNGDRSATGVGDARLATNACTSLNGATGSWVGVASSSDGGGFWLVSGNGGVMGCGDIPAPYGGTTALALNAPVVAMAPTPDRGGYWVAAADGGVFAFGDAGFFGSMGGAHLNAPVVGMAATPDGGGYWLVAADGGVFAFGDATFAGSMGGSHLNAPMTAIAADPAGTGYWTAAADGGVFAFGGAPFEGAMAGTPLAAPVVGMAAAVAIPGSPPCETDVPADDVPAVRPGTIFLGCATSADVLSDLAWTTWTAAGATGTATHDVDNCIPDCADGTYTRYPVTVSLSDPGDVDGMDVFQTVATTPSGAVGSPETVTNAGAFGAWGWVSS